MWLFTGAWWSVEWEAWRVGGPRRARHADRCLLEACPCSEARWDLFSGHWPVWRFPHILLVHLPPRGLSLPDGPDGSDGPEGSKGPDGSEGPQGPDGTVPPGK
jgi:hypothetical protein